MGSPVVVQQHHQGLRRVATQVPVAKHVLIRVRVHSARVVVRVRARVRARV